MTGDQPSPHRGRGPWRVRRDQEGQATPSIVAVASVVLIVLAVVVFFVGAGDDTATEPQAQDETASTPTPTPATTQSARPAEPQGPPTAARTPAPKRAEGKRRDDARDQRRPPRDRARSTPEPQTGPPSVYVEVYNNTGIGGLAASTGAQLQDAGWQVVGVDNWYGDIPASTVYYPAGFEAEADRLAEELGIDRVRGAVAPMKFDRLTVILTPDAA